VCILATNRTIGPDRALSRRIALKLVFGPPDRAMRLRIWETRIPDSLPLASDVDLEALSASALTGGRIKNVVLNAAER